MPALSPLSPFGQTIDHRGLGLLMGQKRPTDSPKDASSGAQANGAPPHRRNRWVYGPFPAATHTVDGMPLLPNSEPVLLLDEITALATGYRPAMSSDELPDAVADATQTEQELDGFFSRSRAFAIAFGVIFDLGRPARAAEIDKLLARERSDAVGPKRHVADLTSLPDGAMVALGAQAYAVRGLSLIAWDARGYREKRPRPEGGRIVLLTPPASIAVLREGYRPQWHPSCELLVGR